MATETSWEEHQLLKQTERRLAFLKRLQEVVARVHSAADIDQIMLELSRDIRALFGCDRLTLYTVSACRTMIESKIKVGMDSFKDFVLPIAHSSIAGHVALTKRTFNIRDVYDSEELRSHSRDMRFLDKVDKRTGYRTREMVAAPLVSARNGELLGVLQLINNRMGGSFSPLVEEGVAELCKALAVAFEQRLVPQLEVHTRFDPLVLLGTLARPELELAKRHARRKQLDLEDVLLDVFQVKKADLGAAYAHFFEVPYEPFSAERERPSLLQNFKREYVEHNGWLILAEAGKSLMFATLDPERLRASRTVEDMLPGYTVQLRVTTRREFAQMVEQMYGVQTEVPVSDDEVLERIHRIVGDALAVAAPELHASVQPEYSRIMRTGGDKQNEGQLTLRIALKLT